MRNNRKAITEIKNHRKTKFKSTYCFQCNSLGGAKWRYIPKEYGNWNIIYHKFRKWIEEGVFEKILQTLTNSKYYLFEMDLTFCKVHQNATDALKKLGAQAIGISNGVKTTKIHALVNENFQLIK